MELIGGKLENICVRELKLIGGKLELTGGKLENIRIENKIIQD